MTLWRELKEAGMIPWILAVAFFPTVVLLGGVVSDNKMAMLEAENDERVRRYHENLPKPIHEYTTYTQRDTSQSQNKRCCFSK